MPFFGSLFAIEDDGHIVAGMVSAPALNDRWWAEKGQGAFYNGTSMQTSTIDTLKEANGFMAVFLDLKHHRRQNRLFNY